MSDDRLIQVTMTRSAAERFKRALTAGDSALMPDDLEPPVNDRDRLRWEHADWLRWGRSRVAHAEQIADAEAGPSTPASSRTQNTMEDS